MQITKFENYSLDIVSYHKDSYGKTFKKHNVNGIETIGVFDHEPFEIVFKNKSWQKVQVKLAIDGVDILCGEEATLDAVPKMWVVEGNSELRLKAYPESNFGGSKFVFTHHGLSVAAHIAKDTSNIGIISAAVFSEGHVPDYTFIPYYPWRTYDQYPIYPQYPYWYTITRTGSTTLTGNWDGGRIVSQTTAIGIQGAQTMNSSCYVSENAAVPGVAAGEYVEQKLSFNTPLIKPVLEETLRVRYIWWNELKEEIAQENKKQLHPTGFSGTNTKHIDLSRVPKLHNQHVTQLPSSISPLRF